jgi:hypothetical protein
LWIVQFRSIAFSFLKWFEAAKATELRARDNGKSQPDFNGVHLDFWKARERVSSTHR